MSVQLTSSPAFGFEYETRNASAYRTKAWKAVGVDIDEKIGYWAANFFKVLGVFFPFVGVARMIDAVFISNDPNKIFHFSRGLAEFFGAGLVLLAIDLGVTAWRAYSSNVPVATT